jgi:glycogen debranching enzyme
MTSLVDEAQARSIDLLERASSTLGFVASPSFDHYAQLWARDAAISSLGAIVTGEPDLIETAVRTMTSLARATTPLGQVAAVIQLDSESWDWGEGGVVDATAWYVILTAAVMEVTGDSTLADKHWPTVSKAMEWLRHQDVTGSGLISAAPSTDWMDSSLVRSGRTLSLNGLYHWAAVSTAKVARIVGEEPPVDPDDLAWRINALFWPTGEVGPERLMLLDQPPEQFPHGALISAYREATGRRRRHYLSHVIHSHFDEHCDVLANLVLICTEVADPEKSRVILDHLRAASVDDPYPSRSLAEPVDPKEPSSMFVTEVETHLNPRWRNEPYQYHNGGIWPFVGGFHTAALALQGRDAEASTSLSKLAAANELDGWGFHEWLHGVSGEPRGARGQTWNAGTYLLAEAAIRNPAAVGRLFA